MSVTENPLQGDIHRNGLNSPTYFPVAAISHLTLKCGPVAMGRLVSMRKIAPVTVHIENAIAGVFANWILRGKFKQILLKVNPSKA